MFDQDSFLSGSMEGDISTDFTPIPEGDYTGVITKIEGRELDDGRRIMDVHWKIDAPSVEDAHDQVARQSVWLTYTDAGALDAKKNQVLGYLLSAVGFQGKAWAPQDLIGQAATITVKNRMAPDGRVFSDVKGTVAL